MPVIKAPLAARDLYTFWYGPHSISRGLTALYIRESSETSSWFFHVGGSYRDMLCICLNSPWCSSLLTLENHTYSIVNPSLSLSFSIYFSPCFYTRVVSGYTLCFSHSRIARVRFCLSSFEDVFFFLSYFSTSKVSLSLARRYKKKRPRWLLFLRSRRCVINFH